MAAENDGTDLLILARAKRSDYRLAHLSDSAVFWAAKAVVLSKGQADDVYNLADTFYEAGSPHRALHALQTSGLLTSTLAGRYLGSLAHAALKQWDEALKLLSEDACSQLDGKETFGPPQVRHAIYTLRGHLHMAQHTPDKAVAEYRAALEADPLCAETLTAITDNYLLSGKDERELVKSLPYAKVGGGGDAVSKLYTRLVCEEAELIANLGNVDLLANDSNVLASDARRLCSTLDYEGALRLTQKGLAVDSFHPTCLSLQVVCFAELNKINDLFSLVHEIVAAQPNTALSQWAIGVYYLAVQKRQMARRYFSKAIDTDESYGAAFLGFAHSFASDGEHDHAMAAYTSAARLLKGCSEPLMYAGVEHGHLGNFPLAVSCLNGAMPLADHDPVPWLELGVIQYRKNGYEEALHCFSESLNRCRALIGREGRTKHRVEIIETVLNNLGHTLRCLGRFPEAATVLQEALQTGPPMADTVTALGFVHQLMGQTELAIQSYNKALSLDPCDALSSQLLSIAVSCAVNTPLPTVLPLAACTPIDVTR